jgi:hypothetical protein
MPEPADQESSTQKPPKQLPAADLSRYCPNCSAQLVELRCKLKCPQCDFYLNCSDFY